MKRTPPQQLKTAILNGNSEHVARILTDATQNNIDVINLLDSNQQNALHHALAGAYRSDIAAPDASQTILQQLLKHPDSKTALEQTDRNGYTPLFYCAQSKDKVYNTLAAIMLANGADLYAVNPNNQRRPIDHFQEYLVDISAGQDALRSGAEAVCPSQFPLEASEPLLESVFRGYWYAGPLALIPLLLVLLGFTAVNYVDARNARNIKKETAEFKLNLAYIEFALSLLQQANSTFAEVKTEGKKVAKNTAKLNGGRYTQDAKAQKIEKYLKKIDDLLLQLDQIDLSNADQQLSQRITNVNDGQAYIIPAAWQKLDPKNKDRSPVRLHREKQAYLSDSDRNLIIARTSFKVLCFVGACVGAIATLALIPVGGWALAAIIGVGVVVTLAGAYYFGRKEYNEACKEKIELAKAKHTAMNAYNDKHAKVQSSAKKANKNIASTEQLRNELEQQRNNLLQKQQAPLPRQDSAFSLNSSSSPGDNSGVAFFPARSDRYQPTRITHRRTLSR